MAYTSIHVLQKGGMELEEKEELQEEPRVYRIETIEKEIVKLQQECSGPIGGTHHTLTQGVILTQRELQAGRAKLKHLVRIWSNLFVDEEGVMRSTIHKAGCDE